MTVDATSSGQFAIGGDLTVTRLGFGAMRIVGAGVWGPPDDRDEVLRVLRRLPEIGIDLVDTADAYGPFVSEDLIAEALAPYDRVTVATKGGLVRYPNNPSPWPQIGDPHYLRQCVHMSLRRLRVERLDLWQLHRVDPKVPQKEQFDVIRSFLDEGLIRHAGLSQVTVAQIEEARTFFPVATVQNRYNIADRSSEDVLDYCTAHGIGFIPWRPLAPGDLGTPNGAVSRIAAAKGATAGQIALAWLLRRSPVMLPIPGTSSVSHLEENAAAASIELNDAEFGELTAGI
ncbi:aldo/keto reductase [Sphingomonas sp. NBWT7]|uniref:aldo/keto reductase n=1 Tax=Sphingomonas sp. NBWT7 TaxID=2596913 RepID=UPI001627211C|nr:aldo/keto reductase [Sphingomonas sp. NBWT7]QNE31101.1 aldo/keto reductase [Sphingomonas sp. NBWT7]